LNHTRSGVLQLEVLIGELGAVDGLASSAVVVGEVATLDMKKVFQRRCKNSLRVNILKIRIVSD